ATRRWHSLHHRLLQRRPELSRRRFRDHHSHRSPHSRQHERFLLGRVAFGVSYNCQVSISSSAGSPTGNITSTFDGGSPISVPINNGSAQFVIPQPAGGN